ncbi:hypothetical protein Q8A67_023267 [Cirrhinus molitorella]|uniref:Uncharacterized protein n=1 Tax=Cirrhinus molitorella TaxID=172907 RepID=A0AA88TA13_9TELE|nr:hypothetical protein Q8A67_023267 [Cirrhinus molitorella]
MPSAADFPSAHFPPAADWLSHSVTAPVSALGLCLQPPYQLRELKCGSGYSEGLLEEFAAAWQRKNGRRPSLGVTGGETLSGPSAQQHSCFFQSITDPQLPPSS